MGLVLTGLIFKECNPENSEGYLFLKSDVINFSKQIHMQNNEHVLFMDTFTAISCIAKEHTLVDLTKISSAKKLAWPNRMCKCVFRTNEVSFELISQVELDIKL